MTKSLPLTYDSLRRLHKINSHLSAVANEIEELGPNAVDYALISELLNNRTGIDLRKLRDICDIMVKIEGEEEIRAKLWDAKYMGR